jgi:hypothetical protein
MPLLNTFRQGLTQQRKIIDPNARDYQLCKQLELALGAQPDPAVDVQHRPLNEEAPPLTVTRVLRVYAPDSNGHREVLFLDDKRQPRRAMVTANEPYTIQFIEDGW